MPRIIRFALCGLAAFTLFAASAQARVVHIIVAFSAGGPVDTVARALGQELASKLDCTVVVDNKPGANGAIGAQAVLQAPADGNTLWLTSVGAAAINPSLYPHLGYNMRKDFAPVSLVVDNNELLVVNKKNPAQNIEQFVAETKKRAEPTPMASSGVGSVPHLAIEQLREATGAKLLNVPYRGAAPAINAVLAGQAAGFFGDIPGLMSFVRAGQLKALGLAAAKRTPVLPDVKTLAEQGVKGVDTDNWYGLFVAAKTPAATVAALNKAVVESLDDPKLHAKLLALGAVPAPSTPQHLEKLLASDTAKWAKLIHREHITLGN